MKTFNEYINTQHENTNNGTYVGIKVSNANELYDWFKTQDIENLVLPNDYHVTIAYSKKHFTHTLNKSNITITPNNIIGFEMFDKVLVMLLNSPELEIRHKQTDDEGAIYDYPTYTPHITLSYNYDITKHQQRPQSLNTFYTKPSFDIVLEDEYVEELDVAYGE